MISYPAFRSQAFSSAGVNSFPMSQRTAVVTGASSGIGRATALRLAADGFHVLAVGRDERALSDVCRDIERAKGSAERLAIDVTADEAPHLIVMRATAKADGIDALVNAAGIIAAADISGTTDAAWDEMMTINVRAPFRLLRQAVPALAARRGAVVNLSSVAGTRAFPNLMAYCVSKSAVDQFTRTAALDLAPKGIRVNAVNPGVVVTNLHRRGGMDDVKYAAFLEHSKATHPLGRAGTPEEVASLIGYLVSPDAAWVTGDTISIDGGRHLTCLR
jgi:NAD(P)-dependent dehydrogenase (short-subunit alcohol dehydrogenase family)